LIVQTNGTTLYYEQEGVGQNVLLMPGLGASVHVWYPQLKALSSVLRLTVMDPRGHGRSGKPEGPYSIGRFAEDAAGLIEALGLAPVVVVGSSMSALVGVELAATRPELLAGLVLVGGFATLPPTGKERFRERARVAESEGMGPLADLVAAGALGAHTHATQPGLVGLFRAALLGNDPPAYAAAARAVADADVTPRLGAVRCPTLILLGSQEQVAPLPAARALQAGITQAQVRVLPDAGHLPFLEQPGAFNAALMEFAASLAG